MFLRIFFTYIFKRIQLLNILYYYYMLYFCGVLKKFEKQFNVRLKSMRRRVLRKFPPPPLTARRFGATAIRAPAA